MSRHARRSRRWAREEIAALDPIADHERIAHLTADVRFGNPLLLATLYTVTFIRQMAVPSIAAMVHRGGRGPIARTTRKRNDDTLIIFGELFSHGHSTERGQDTIERLNEIHSAYPITNDDYLYTLGTIVFENERTPKQLGIEPVTAKERVASFHLWQGIGERMHIADIPADETAFLTFVEAYERDRWAYSESGRAVTDAVILDLVSRFVPRPLHRVAIVGVIALLPPDLRALHRLPEPSRAARFAVRWAARAFFAVLGALPDPPDRAITSAFTAEYGGGGCPHLADVGPQHARGAASAATPAGS